MPEDLEKRRIMSGTRLLAAFAMAYCLSSLALACLAEQYVEITGQLETITYATGKTSNDSVSARETIAIACVVGTNEWRIDNELDSGEQKCLFDGTNVYLGMRALQHRKERKEGEAFHIEAFDATIPKPPSIKTHSSPDGRPWGGVEVTIPWLAFCSGSYLKSAGRIVPLPVYPLLDAPARYGYSDKSETFPDDFGLPRTVDLFTSATLYKSSVRQWCNDYFLDFAKAKSSSGLPDGMLKFHYAVTASTNFQGWNMPLRFEYVEYESISGMMRPLFGGTGVVTSIQNATKPENPCAPGMEHVVEDWRFRGSNKVDAIIYMSTNSSPTPTNDPTLQNIFMKSLAQAQSRPRQSRATAKWTVMIAMSLSAVLLVFALLRRSRVIEKKDSSQ